jgi:hypothetical protein
MWWSSFIRGETVRFLLQDFDAFRDRTREHPATAANFRLWMDGSCRSFSSTHSAKNSPATSSRRIARISGNF